MKGKFLTQEIICDFKEHLIWEKGAQRQWRSILGMRRRFQYLQAICETGIRIRELHYIMLEAVKCEKVIVHCKKNRPVFIAKEQKNYFSILDFSAVSLWSKPVPFLASHVMSH